MGRSTTILKLAVCFAIAVQFLEPCLSEAQETVIIASNQSLFFRSFAYTSTEYLYLRCDGRYGHIDCEHLFVEEKDRGTWHQDTSGVVTLESEMHFRNIEANPLAIWTWHTNVVEYLPRIKEIIDQHINNPEKENFDPKYVDRNMVRIPSPRGPYDFSPISVDYSAKQITKEQLSVLSRQIDEFLSSTNKNHFHVVPMTYKNRTFLLWKDRETPINRDLAGIMAAIDSATNNVLPAYIFFAIDEETFEKGSRLTQEFIFYPEMTEKVRRSLRTQKDGTPPGGGDP